jgi:hypothetical protein
MATLICMQLIILHRLQKTCMTFQGAVSCEGHQLSMHPVTGNSHGRADGGYCREVAAIQVTGQLLHVARAEGQHPSAEEEQVCSSWSCHVSSDLCLHL